MDKAERALQRATKEAKYQGDQLDKLIGQIDPTVAAYSRLDKMEQQLKAHRDAGRLPTEDYKVYQAQLQATRDSISKTDAVLNKSGMTAKATAAALRNVPAQFTDIAVSLQAGQAPLTVLLQQGGQLKDMFGGIGPAAKALGGYVLGLVNPFTLAAAAAAALAYAYKQGSDEQTAFTQALVLSGNAAGTNAQQLASQAQSVSQSVGTVGAAAQVLAQLAASGKIPASQFDMIAVAALKLQEATGIAAEETVKNFEKLAKDPVKYSKELNDALNYLTTAQYAQIDALQRQGDAQGAANLAEQAYAEALTKRADAVKSNLGYVESAWLSVKNAAKSAWDSFLDIGREATFEQKMSDLQDALANAQRLGSGPRGGGGQGEVQIQQQITDLLVVQQEQRRRIAAQQDAAAKDKAGIASVEALNKSLDDTASKQDKLAKRYAEIDKQVAAAAARGVHYSAAQIDQLKRAADEQYKVTQAPKGPAYQEDAGQKMLDNLRQQAAALQVQSETNDKLGTQAQALVKFQQQIADIKSKDILTADQKSLLASQDLITAQLKKNVALEQEVAARKQATEEAQKLQAFQENQQSKLDNTQDGLNSQLAGIGLGEKGRERLKEDIAIRKDYADQMDKLNKQLNTGQISEDLYQKESDTLEEALASRLVMQQDYYNQVDEMSGNFFLGMSEAWANYADEATNYQQQAADATASILNDVTSSVASNIESLIKGQESIGDFFKNIAADMANAVIGALVKMAAQWLVYQAVQILSGKATQASAATTLIANATATAAQASLAAFASTAAIPIVGPFLAPAAAAAAAAFSAPLVATVSTAALAGMAHDGIDSIPETGTWLLQKGERVTTAQTSAKLDQTLNDIKSPSNMGGTTVNLIEDASRAGQSEERTGDQGERMIDVFVADLLGDGRTKDAMSRKFGLQSVGT